MRRIIFIFSTAIYLILLLGFILHTSDHPEILGKYTIKYTLTLIFLVLFFPCYQLFLRFMFIDTNIKFRRKYYVMKEKQKIILFFIIFFFLFISIEVYLREKFKNYESTQYLYTIDNFHPFLQSRLNKHENLTINSLGFRGEEISIKKPVGTYRIVVMGGSTVLNREVLFEKNAVRLLEKKLRNYYQNRRIEVINAGKDYYTSEHSLIQYMFNINDLKPDLIIMWQGINDMWMSCLSEGTYTHGSYQNDYSHFFGAASRIVFNYFRPQAFIQFKLLSFDFLFITLQDNLFSDITNLLKEYSKSKLVRDYMNKRNTISTYEFPSIYAYSRNLSYLLELAKKDRIRLILGNQPNLLKDKNNFEEVKKINFICAKNSRYYDLGSIKYGLDLFNKITKKIAEENNIDFIDLEKNIPKNLNYFLDAVHYTQEGNELLSQLFFKELVSKNYLE